LEKRINDVMASENRLMGFRIEADSPGNVEVAADKPEHCSAIGPGGICLG